MLAPLEDAGLVDAWDDQRIPVGAQWRDEIAEAIDAARVAVLLVSKDFLASRFIKTANFRPCCMQRGQTGSPWCRCIWAARCGK